MADTKKRNQLLVLGALVFLAALVWYFYVAKPVVGPAAHKWAPSTYVAINAPDYVTVIDKLKAAETTVYKPSGRNIFTAAPIPPPVDPVKQAEVARAKNQGPTPPPPPPPAQLSMKFYGYGTVPSNGARRAFLLDGEDVHIVGEGEVVQNHIRILRIGN